MKPTRSKSLYVLVSEDTWHYIYAFSSCHAVNLWLSHLDSLGLLPEKLPNYTISKIPNFIR